MSAKTEDAWIALLNDLSLNDVMDYEPRNLPIQKDTTNFDDEIFFNQMGEPTDKFLEALKADLSRVPAEDTKFKPLHGIKSPKKVFSQRLKRSDPEKSESEDSDQYSENKAQKKEKKTQKLKPEESPRYKKRSTSKTDQPHEIEIGLTSRKQMIANEKRKTSHTDQQFSRRTDSLKNGINQSQSISFLEDNCDIENDMKVKSLQLRLKGQLKCIKSLELQLQNATELLNQRTKQIYQLQAKLKSISDSYNYQQPIHNQVKLNEESRFQDMIDQYKRQIEILQSKLQDEVSKRHRSEERWKMMKDYSEKAKIRSSELEIQNAELKGLNAELQNKMDKYRKSFRETASEISVQNNQLVSKENELFKLTQRAEKAETLLIQKQEELMERDEELNSTKKELQVKCSEIKQLKLQIDILHEKELTRRMETRINAVPNSKQERQGRHVPGEYSQPFEMSNRDRLMEWKSHPEDHNAKISHATNRRQKDSISLQRTLQVDDDNVTNIDHFLQVEAFEELMDTEAKSHSESRLLGNKRQRSSLDDGESSFQTESGKKTSDLVKEIAGRTRNAIDSNIKSEPPPSGKLSKLQQLYEKMSTKSKILD